MVCVPHGRLLPVGEVEAAASFVQYVCAFCNQPTDEDPRYVHLTLDWPHSGETQAAGAHTACLRRVVHASIPLAGE